NEISLKSFLNSIACSLNWDDNSGGKTGASFIKSYDQKFVFKEIEDKEYAILQNIAPEYFKYQFECFSKGKPTVLAKTLGMFEVQCEKNTSYWIAMENLFFGMDPDVKIYDLKGSELNRLVSKNGEMNW